MSNDYVKSGYSGLYTGPFLYTKPQNNVLYWTINTTGRDIILIPLTDNFFNTAYNILKDATYQHVHIICPMLNMINISDIYTLYTEVKFVLGKTITIYTQSIGYTGDFPDEFRSNIMVTEGETIIYNDDEALGVTFSYFDTEENVWTPRNILYYDGTNRYLFVSKMTEELAIFLETNKADMFDKIHLPFINRKYGGLTYTELVREHSWFIGKCVINSFSSSEEETFCDDRKIEKGEVIF